MLVNKKIVICECGAEGNFPMPLIWTFVFKGFEYWCAYCGKTYKPSEVVEIKNTKKLETRLKLYKKHSELFLDAKSTQICERMYLGGKWVQQEKLPKDFKDKAQKIIDEYKYKEMPKC